jgi:anti-sigma-K factor RskA
MMALSEDHIALAAEYALGTLDAGERAQVESLVAVDPEFEAIVQSWAFRLGVLNQMVGAVEPRPQVWDRIKAAVVEAEPQAVVELPEARDEPQQPAAAELASIEPAPLAAAPVVDNSNVIRLSLRARRWRNVAVAMSALAAVLVAMLSVQVYRPDLLPGGLRPKPRIQVVEVRTPPAPPAAQFVALLQKDSASPAFILTVDAATKNFTVRRVGASPEPGKSFELWIVSDKLQRPRSLGVIGSADFTVRPALASYDADTVNRATYAVTVEPEGGSPTGAATGPIVFTGKLIETVPPGERLLPPR